MIDRYDSVILSNGEMPFHEIPLILLRSGLPVVCCDGAVYNLLKLDSMPNAIVGDCDSISDELFSRFEEIIHVDKSQEYNDLNKALQFCLANNYRKVAIVGGFGLREDHAMGNTGVMMMFAKEMGMEIEMVTNYGVFTPAFQTITLSSYPGQQISLFSFQQDTRFTFYQLKYPVHNQSFHYFWEATLNEALSDQFTIEFQTGMALIYRAY
ncbi:MAG: thiamine diphosphokinase [Bacteroidales bacterium]|jgi:thiamine pyrophosphokinase|nr:thiamine diphosphokinase [Bacteroidales bacterium]